MKCPTCKKDFAAGVKAAYQLGLEKGHELGEQSGKKEGYKFGLQDGSNQYQQHLNRIEKAFGELFRELQVMDLRTPDKVNSIYLNRGFVERLIEGLKKRGDTYWVRKLKTFVKNQLGDTLSAEAKLRQILCEIGEE